MYDLMRPKTRHVAMIGAIMFAIITGLIAWYAVNHTDQPAHHPLGETSPGKTAAILPIEADTLIFWQPWDSPTPIMAQSLTTGTQTGILPYPDVDPVRWLAAPADQDAFHIIWLEQDERLRSAVVSPSGETLRGPITLDFQAMRDFSVLPHVQNQALVIWRTGDQQITIQQLDAAGRPGVATRLAVSQVKVIAASLDRTGTLYLGWISSSAPNVYTFYYQTLKPDNPELDAPVLLHTQELPPTAAITNLVFSLDSTHAYLAWEMVTAAPTAIRQQADLLAFPLDDPSQVTHIPLQLPQYTAHCARPTTTALAVGKLCQLATSPDSAAEIRWLTAASGQALDAALLIATSRAGQGWHPVMIVLQNGAALGYRVLSAQPADAGPPALSVSAAGQIVATWGGIDGVIPELYAVQLN